MVAGAPGSGDVAPPAPGGMLGNLITGCEYIKFKCKQTMCNSVLGQMLNNTLAPMSTFSGGLVPPLCPPNAVNPADLAKPSDSAAGAAARIKADEADAKARAAAVRFLGTVDCHYWPEAQDALINALRADRNECVRLAAAVALGNGCCCTPKTITALGITVAGSDEDGNPSETSERVRSAAYVALSQCVDRFPAPAEAGPPPEPTPPPRPEPTPEGPVKPLNGTSAAAKPGEKTKVVPAVYYERAATTPMPRVLTRARESLRANAVTSTSTVIGPTPGAAKQGLLGIAYSAITSTAPAPAPAAPADSDDLPVGVTRVIEVTPTVKKSTSPPPLSPPPVQPGPSRLPGLLPVSPNQPLLLSPSTPPVVRAPAHPPTEVKRKPAVTAPTATLEPLPVISAPVTAPTIIVSPARVVAPSVLKSPESVVSPVPPPRLSTPTLTPPTVPPLSARPPLPPAPSPPSTGFYGTSLERWRSTAPAAPIVADAGRVPPPLPAPPPVIRPQPTGSPVMVAGFYGTPFERPRPAPLPVVAPPEMDEQAGRWLAVLRDAPDPEARDWAASRLQGVNWRAHPEVVHALVTGALRDPTPSVRTACIRTLDHMDAGTTPVLSALDTLAADRDPAVKHAAKEALQDLLARRRQ